jgi:hypothetical protein
MDGQRMSTRGLNEDEQGAAVRLWEVDHPYYCEPSNYYSNNTCSRYGSWTEFLSEEGALDLDMNLAFRFDWKPLAYCEDEAEVAAWHAKHDDYYRAYELSIFWMGQRKGIYRSTQISVCRADEPAVREWLTVRWEHLQLLWQPIAAPAPVVELGSTTGAGQ